MKSNININLTAANSDIINDAAGQEQDKQYKIIENYERLVKSNIDNLNRILDNETCKALIIYNFGLVLELFLKMTILKLGKSSLEEIGSLEHQISIMFQKVIDGSDDLSFKNVCKYIKDRMTLIKYPNGNRVDFDTYADFRYNHLKGQQELIFTEDITTSDIKHIKEALKCIESVIQ